jgi:hypothetical protein
MKAGELKNKPFIAILVKRTALFFFSLSALTVFLYAIGTAQEFMDSTQLFLLRASVVLGLCLAMNGIYGLALNLWLFIQKRQLGFFGSSAFYIITGILGAALAAAAAFIIVAAGGNGP